MEVIVYEQQDISLYYQCPLWILAADRKGKINKLKRKEKKNYSPQIYFTLSVLSKS